MSGTFTSLRNHNYRLFAAGMLVSNVGVWMQRVAQDWLVLELTDSGVALGITTGLQFLPMLLLGLWGGVLADRYPKRALLVASQVFMGVVSLVLGLLVVTGLVNATHVFVLAFLLGCGSAIGNPARQAFVPEMVDRDDVSNAVGLNSASFNVARVIGPAVAGFMIVWGGTGPVFLVNTAASLAICVALSRMNGDELHPTPPRASGGGALREGLRYVRARPDLLFVLVVVFFVGTFGLNFQMTMALMATDVFGKGAGEYGVLGSVMAVGSVTGALLAARRGQPRLRLLVGAALAFGCFEIAAGLMPSYPLFAVSLVPVGVTALTLITAANSTMQLSVDPSVRGRVMALYMAVFFGGTPLGAPLVGWVAEAFGARWSLVLGGGVSIAATVVASLLLARHDGLRLRRRRSAGFVVEKVLDAPEPVLRG